MVSQQVLSGEGEDPKGRLMSEGEVHQLPRTAWVSSEHLRQKALILNAASCYEIKTSIGDWPIL